MYLKRLELHGFKSFATPTKFEFGPGVTCIAGPNGAGKTNVAEAIRWVLGEHASRIIRVRKTEDVIFSGSAKRAPLGMAEVRIALDNEEGWLPVPFQEVVVARRAYRSGENEYYLNQSRVRLRDVTELFLRAQVGQNSYAFMGQGLVEQVLTLRPEERRSFIEEAAEVKLHREKLEEARNRLRATRDNLDRVQLVVNEIEPRLRQLERQAGRAETHARLSAELAEALQTLFGQQWQGAQEALTAALATCDQRKEAFESARREVEACEEGLVALVSAIEERRRDIETQDTQLRGLDDARHDLERRITADDERLALLTARREELTSEVEVLRRERDEQAAVVAEQTTQGAALDEELAAARTPDADTRELDGLTERLHAQRRELARAEKDAADAAARLAAAESSMSALGRQEERLRGELASLEGARAEQIAALKTWAREFATKHRRLLELIPMIERSTQELAALDERLAKASAEVKAHQDELRTLDAEIRSAELRLDAVEGADVELPPPDAGVRALLAAGGKLPGEEPSPEDRIHGLIGMLGEVIRVPAGLERAVEAALAENLHAVIVSSQDDALAATELLVTGDLGRATILPLNDIRAVHPVNLMEEKGVVGVASELVRCEQRYRSIVNALLGRTIVVENLGIAKAVLRRGLGSVVTLDGIVLHTVGSVTAGSAKPVRRAIARRREVGELPADIERLRAAHTQATAALEAAERAEREARHEHDGIAPQLERLRAEHNAIDGALRQHRTRLSSLASRLSGLHARCRELQRSAVETGDGIAAARADADRSKTASEEASAAHDRIANEIEGLEPARARVLARMGTRTTRIAGLEAEQEALERQRNMQATLLARTEETLRRRETTHGQVEEDLLSVGTRLEVARREFEERSQAAATAREELAPARHSLDQLEMRQRSINEELTAARAKSLETERGLLDAEAMVHLRNEEIASLRERLSEEGYEPSDDGEIRPAAESIDDTDDGDEERPPAWLTADARSDGGDLPPMRGGADVDVIALKERVNELRTGIRRLGPVNEQAGEDFTESKERYEFLSGQLTDLREAEESLQGAISELEQIIKERFSATFEKVNAEFKRYFALFFAGGQGELQLTKPDEAGLPGIEIIAQPPRKKVRTLAMLSGGERSLTALALLFALLETHPSPICVLDEVDAALDEANVDRFTGALRQLAERTQFIIITHNRRTLEMANTIYGISMGGDSVSAVLSLRLADIPKN